jgi:hypothetical protein
VTTSSRLQADVPWLTETTRDCFDVTDVGTIGERDGRDDVPSLSGYNQSIFLYIYKIDISAFLLVVGSAPPLCRNTGATPVKTVLGRRLFLAVTWSTAGGFLVSLSRLSSPTCDPESGGHSSLERRRLPIRRVLRCCRLPAYMRPYTNSYLFSYVHNYYSPTGGRARVGRTSDVRHRARYGLRSRASVLTD